MKKNTKDLTTGNITTKLLSFTIPLLISVFCQQFYNLADSMIAGKYLGELSFAAVSNSYEVTLIFMAVSVGSNIGCSVIISQLYGAKKYSEMKCGISTTFICTAVLSVLLTIIGIITLPLVLNCINTPISIFDESVQYLTIYILGFTFMYLYNIANGAFSSMGDSLTPLIFLVFSSVLNIFLDIKMVSMGIQGIALATLISQAVACVLSVIVLVFKLRGIKDRAEHFFSIYILKKIASIAVPSIFQQGVISIGNIILQGIINGYGTAVIAGYGAAVKLNNFTVNTMTTLGNGISAFTAQNIGAAKFERVNRGFKVGCVIALVICTLFFVPYFFFSEKLISFFIEAPTQTAIRTGKEYLCILSPFYITVALKLVSDGVLRGGGAMKCFLTATFTDLVLRVVLAYVLSYILGSVGIWMAWPIGWIVGMSMSLHGYRTEKWKKNII